MDEKLWPANNPAADNLLASFLDRVRPGWAALAMAPVPGSVAQAALWPWGERFKGRAGLPGTPAGEIEVDRGLEKLAAGQPFPWAQLSEEGLRTLVARLLVALTGATYAMIEGDRTVMILPAGLGPEDQATAIALRLLYQGPLSIEGM